MWEEDTKLTLILELCKVNDTNHRAQNLVINDTNRATNHVGRYRLTSHP